MNTKEDQRPVKSRTKPGTGQNTGQKQRRRTGTHPASEVTYTQPSTFQRNRFLLQLATLAAVVLALLFGMSLFFKVEEVRVHGVSKYTEWDIREASGIQDGDNLMTLSKSKISSRIYAKLPYVKEVRIGRQLPNTIKIEVVELDVTYAVEAEDGSWWLMRADGMMIEKIPGAETENYTKILGIRVQSPVSLEQAVALQPEPEGTMPDGTPIPITVRAEEQLSAALSIMQALEDNGVMGQAASIDVTDVGDLQLWYGDRFRVLLGDTNRIPDKISIMATAVNDYMATYESGVLDVRATTQQEDGKSYEVIYIPFE